jgi:hypothetical protein
MKKGVEIIKGDHDETIIQYSEKPGEPKKIDVYLTTRAGISWPKADHPGYFCVIGLKDEPGITGKKPLVLLAEREHHHMERYFERLTINARRLYSENLFADLEHNQGFERSFRDFVRDRKVEGIRLIDSSEFEDFEHIVSLIRQKKKDGLLSIEEGTVLNNQIQSMTTDDLQDIKKNFPAVAALCRVLGSYEFFPWQKPHSGFVGFSNIEDRGQSKTIWNGEYNEVVIND